MHWSCSKNQDPNHRLFQFGDAGMGESKPESPLHGLFQDMIPHCSTRSKAAGKIEVPAANTKNLALWNMATT